MAHPFSGLGFNSWSQKFGRPSSGFNIPIITDGLFMYLDAGAYSGSGTTWSDLVGSNDAILVNGPTFVPSDGTTETGDGYFNFDGSDDRADLDNLVIPAQYSIHIVVFKDGNTTKIAFIDQGSIGRTQPVRFYVGDSGAGSGAAGKIKIQHGGAFATAGAVGGTMQQNRWYIITATYDGTDLKLYENAVLKDTQSSGGHSGTAGASIADNFPDYASSMNNFPGNLAQVGVYNRALSQSEVTQNFNAISSKFRLS